MLIWCIVVALAAFHGPAPAHGLAAVVRVLLWNGQADAKAVQLIEGVCEDFPGNAPQHNTRRIQRHLDIARVIVIEDDGPRHLAFVQYPKRRVGLAEGRIKPVPRPRRDKRRSVANKPRGRRQAHR